MSFEIEKKIEAYIESKHKLGERSGGSGHKGYVSYKIEEYDQKKLEDGRINVSFKYAIITETEFTYYPDNPPYEDRYEGEIIINTE